MKYFNLSELTYSVTAKERNIANNPDLSGKENLYQLVKYVLDPLREAYGKPIRINSGYRSPELNALVGGAKRSYHLQGLAADLCATYEYGDDLAARRKKNKNIYQTALRLSLPLAELIAEKGNSDGPDWIHIALDRTKIPV